MANDIQVKFTNSPAIAIKWNVPSGGVATIAAGTPTKTVDAAAASPYLGTTAIMADGDGTTTQRFTGIAKSTSTDTASVAGEVFVYAPLPGLVYNAKAKTSTTADTQAEVDALRGKRVVFDLTAGVWSVDAAAADAVVNQVVIIDGDYRTQRLDFLYAHSGSFMDFRISA